jgi:ABC-type transporter Mla subunit MlaD
MMINYFDLGKIDEELSKSVLEKIFPLIGKTYQDAENVIEILTKVQNQLKYNDNTFERNQNQISGFTRMNRQSLNTNVRNVLRIAG